MPVVSDTCCTTAHRTQVAPSTLEAQFSHPSGAHVCVKTGVSFRSGASFNIIDAAQASETRHREDLLGYFINKLYLCSLHFSTYLLNR